MAYGGPFGETYFFTTTDIHDDPKIRRFIPHEVLDAKVRRSAWFHKDEHVFPKIAASAAKIVKAGGHVCIGSHGEMQGIGYHWEMWALASGGWATWKSSAPPPSTAPRRSASPRTSAASSRASSPTSSS